MSLTVPGNAPVDAPASTDAELGRGTVVGRYLLLDRLGAGAMGVVYAGYDPELDRKVALKLVLPSKQGEGSWRTRLLREALALARLSHPNVVTIHDAGAHGDQVWIAMEFVAGDTLGAWARAQPRPWPAQLAVLMDIARGVAAAHDAGLVHRDLKPDNVMIGHDGRVRVMDFGLAHGRTGDEATDPSGAAAHAAHAVPLAQQLTQAGIIPGTPAYMAPEQWRGDEAGAPADQFSWSVLAWELLYGERPFVADSTLALAVAVTAGNRRPPPRGRRVPGWLRRVIERGLAVDPRARWPSMAALLAALDRGRARTRVRAIATLAGAAALVVGVVAGLHRWDVARKEAACTAEGRAIDALWSAGARDRLREAFVATGVDDAAATAERVIPWIAARADAWTDARAQACRHTLLARDWDESLRASAAWCLEDRQMELAALITEFGRATPTAVHKAVTAATNLGDPALCLDEELLRRLPVPPDEARAGLRAAREDLTHARSLDLMGDSKAGLELAEKARAADSAWPPLQAAAQAQAAICLLKLGQYEQAEAAGSEAYYAGGQAGAWAAAASAATLVIIAANERGHLAEARLWARNAAMAIVLAGDPTRLLEAKRLAYLGFVEKNAGDNAAALALMARAVARFEASLGPDHPDYGKALGNLASAHNNLGQHGEARALYLRALEIYEKALGPDHPDIATIVGNLGGELNALGEYAEARVHLERALKILERSYGPDHPFVATVACNLANTRLVLGDRGPARALFDRCRTIYEAALGPDNPRLFEALSGLAAVDIADGDLAAARAAVARGREIQARSGTADTSDAIHILLASIAIHRAAGELSAARAEAARMVTQLEAPPHASLPALVLALASVDADLGDTAAAHAEATRALALADEAKPPLREIQMQSLRLLAELALRADKPADALPLAERAVAVAATLAGHAGEVAAARFALARALADPTRARALAVAARDGLRDAGPVHARRLAEVERWLTEHTR